MKCFFMSAKPMWALPWGNALELYHGILFHGPGVNLGAKGRFGIESQGPFQLQIPFIPPVSVLCVSKRDF